MATPKRNSGAAENRLLALLPRDEYQRLSPSFETAAFTAGEVLYKQGSPIRDLAFPSSGLITHVVKTRNRHSVEAGSVGREGLVGVGALLGNGVAHLETRVQVSGEGLRVPAEGFRQALQRTGPLRELIMRYVGAFLFQVQQSAGCNRLHLTAPRCCRWLLTAHDAVAGGPFRLTQESLATMLGVRRASITEAARRLQEDGLIRYSRGQISITNRSGLEARSCECYRIIRKNIDDALA